MLLRWGSANIYPDEALPYSLETRNYSGFINVPGAKGMTTRYLVLCICLIGRQRATKPRLIYVRTRYYCCYYQYSINRSLMHKPSATQHLLQPKPRQATCPTRPERPPEPPNEAANSLPFVALDRDRPPCRGKGHAMRFTGRNRKSETRLQIQKYTRYQFGSNESAGS